MSHDLFGFQERGHGWLRLLGDLRVGGILADDMGLGKTVQAIATMVSERAGVEHPLPPTLVVSPMSVTQQWAREIARFAPGPARAPASRAEPGLSARPSSSPRAQATSS